MAEQEAGTQERDGSSDNYRELEFENALQRLEKIVTEMESGELPLKKNMEHFEEGMKLVKHCQEKLGETEKKIEVLINKNRENPEWKPLDTEEDTDSPHTGDSVQPELS